MKILERYNTAIHASSLNPDVDTEYADLDVIGAAGLAARYEPMGIALARLLAGGGQGDVVNEMTNAAYIRSHRVKGGRMTRQQAGDVARAVLAWWRDGRCNDCNGTGYKLIPGTPSLGDDCPACNGTGKMLFDKQFRHEWRDVSNWLRDEVGRSQAHAGVLAMQKIKPLFDL